MAFLLKYKENLDKYVVRILYFRSATKLAIVGGATLLVVNHEVFGANKYTQQIINKVRRSLPDTAEAFDQMPTKQELSDSVVESWNSGMNSILNRFLFLESIIWIVLQAFKHHLNGLLMLQYIHVNYLLLFLIKSKAKKTDRL